MTNNVSSKLTKYVYRNQTTLSNSQKCAGLMKVVTRQHYWFIDLIHQTVTQSIMQHILTVSASPHIYQLCKVVMLIKRSFHLVPLIFSGTKQH